MQEFIFNFLTLRNLAFFKFLRTEFRLRDHPMATPFSGSRMLEYILGKLFGHPWQRFALSESSTV